MAMHAEHLGSYRSLDRDKWCREARSATHLCCSGNEVQNAKGCPVEIGKARVQCMSELEQVLAEKFPLNTSEILHDLLR